MAQRKELLSKPKKQSVSIKESGMKRKLELRVNLKTVKRFARGYCYRLNLKTVKLGVIVIVAGRRVNITNGERFRRIVLLIKMLRFHTHGN